MWALDIIRTELDPATRLDVFVGPSSSSSSLKRRFLPREKSVSGCLRIASMVSCGSRYRLLLPPGL